MSPFGYLRQIWHLNPKTIYFNFKYLPWRKARYFPIWISSRTILVKCKGTVSINEVCRPGMIKIGFGDIAIFDKKRSRTIWEVSGKVIFEGKTEIGHGSKISVGPEGTLKLGNNFAITAETAIIAYKNVSFGINCLLSWDILIMDTDFHKIIDAREQVTNPPADIRIGNNVWIGCRSLILKGAIIPDGNVIAANSVVTKELFGNNQVFGKNPLNILSTNIKWQI